MPYLPLNLFGPVLGLYGGADTGIPLDTVDKMKTVLAAGNAASRASQFAVYPDAPHAFQADDRPSDRKEAAENGSRYALAWFRQHGVAGGGRSHRAAYEAAFFGS